MKNLTLLTILIVIALMSIMILDLHSLKKQQTKQENIAVAAEKKSHEID